MRAAKKPVPKKGKRFQQWLGTNVLFASIPLLTELACRWFAHQPTMESPENIPELAFAVGVMNLAAAGDVGNVIDALKNDLTAAMFTAFQNILNAGMLAASILFGIYVGINTANHAAMERVGPRMVVCAWVVAGFYLLCAPACEWAALSVMDGE